VADGQEGVMRCYEPIRCEGWRVMDEEAVGRTGEREGERVGDLGDRMNGRGVEGSGRGRVVRSK